MRLTTICLIVAITSGCGDATRGEQAAGAQPEQASESPAQASVETQTDAGASFGGMAGPPRQNKILRLAVSDSGFAGGAPAPPAGSRYFNVQLRGASRSSNDVEIHTSAFVFAQNEAGCISRPIMDAPWLNQPFGDRIMFSGKGPMEGQLAFLVPADTQQVRVLVAPAGAGALIVPAGEDFEPSWPTPVATIDDGSTLRVLVLPKPMQLPQLPPAATGREQVVLDVVIENLTTEQGIEFTTSQQLRLVDQSGKFVQPSAATQKIGCRLDDGDVIPPGHSRRFQVVYDMPPGEPRRLNYRGFEVDEVTVDF